jgi:hypothetical protein
VSFDPGGNFDRQFNNIGSDLHQINRRQRLNDQRNRNGGYTDNEVMLGWLVQRFRRMGRVGRLVTIVVVLVVAWALFGQGIIEAIHQARGQ